MDKTAEAQKISGIDWLFLAPGYTLQVAKALTGTQQPVYVGTEWEPFTEKNSPANKDWIAAMNAANLPLTAFSQGGYEAAILLTDVIKGINGPVTRDTVTQALHGMKPIQYPLSGSPYVFGEAKAHAPMQATKVVKLDPSGAWSSRRRIGWCCRRRSEGRGNGCSSWPGSLSGPCGLRRSDVLDRGWSSAAACSIWPPAAPDHADRGRLRPHRGGAYALLGVCAVFTYRLVAVVNFVGAAIGAAGAFASDAAREQGCHWPQRWPGSSSAAGGLVSASAAIMTNWFAECRRSRPRPRSRSRCWSASRDRPSHRPAASTRTLFPSSIRGSPFRLAGRRGDQRGRSDACPCHGCSRRRPISFSSSHIGLHSARAVRAPGRGGTDRHPGARLSLLGLGRGGAATALALMLIAPQRSPNFMSLSTARRAGARRGADRLLPHFWLATVGGILMGLLEGRASLVSGLGGIPRRRALPRHPRRSAMVAKGSPLG